MIGLDTGAGKRWEHKKWTEEGFVEMIRLLRSSPKAGTSSPQILFLGGTEERDRNRRIVNRVGEEVSNARTDHDIRRYISRVDLCDLLATGDTMALHVAVALDKKVVAFFGPTSAGEIELYDKGRKISSDAPCVVCYRTNCDVRPTCMERISGVEVFRAVQELL